MQPAYDDILSRIPETPRWWFNGVPRYKPFEPSDLSVGSDQAALVRVRCQDCGTGFLIAVETNAQLNLLAAALGQPEPLPLLDALRVRAHSLGDPPRHRAPDGSRCPGEAMSVVPVEIVEAWRSDPVSEHRRQPQHEGLLPQE